MLSVTKATIKDRVCLQAIFDAFYNMSMKATNLSKSNVTFSPTPRNVQRNICLVLQMSEKKKT